MAGSVVTGFGGIKTFKTLNYTCFPGQQNGGGKCRMKHGSPRDVFTSRYLCERGKVRPIDAPHVTERQIHKTLCNEEGDVMNLMELRLQKILQVLQENRAGFIDPLQLSGIDVKRGG